MKKDSATALSRQLPFPDIDGVQLYSLSNLAKSIYGNWTSLFGDYCTLLFSDNISALLALFQAVFSHFKAVRRVLFFGVSVIIHPDLFNLLALNRLRYAGFD
ncbi:MAG TPA: hypothetical protein PKC30_13300 [Saprospiraceae bacterium]|nr:hypothetical protein [Saprospiraceae bacterium]